MKIVVTGSTGFVAKAIIDTLIDNGHEIHAIVRESSDRTGINTKSNFFIDDGSSDSLIELFKEIKPDGVLHLASLFLQQHKENEVHALITSNITFGTRLLEASVQNDVPWFINTGTFWQHFENKDYSPVNLYAATKQAFQDIARFYYETQNINFVTIKLNDTFGEGDTRKKVFNLWKGLADSGENLGMSPGEQIIDISYIDDIVEAYTLMIDQLKDDTNYIYAGKSYSVSSSERMTLIELSKTYEKATGDTLDITWGERPYRDREVMFPWDKGEAVPGWKQTTSIGEAINKVIKK
jgi:nucleoside-diphosphate-sugar epimerase